MHQRRVWMVVAAAAGCLSAFLPWVNVPIAGTIAGTDGTDGWLVLGLFALALTSALSGARASVPSSGRRIAVGLLGLLGAGHAIWKIREVYAMKGDLGVHSNPFTVQLAGSVSVGVGLWLMAIAGTVLVLEAIRSTK